MVDSADLLLHPVRLRILLAFLRERALTPGLVNALTPRKGRRRRILATVLVLGDDALADEKPQSS